MGGTVRFSAFGVGCEVVADGTTRRAIEWSLRGFAGPVDTGPAATLLRYRLEADGPRWRVVTPEGLERSDTPAGVTLHLYRDLTRAVIERTDAVVLHAGCVSIDGGAVVLAGRMESGKSTLTAGLVASGCGYLSDEAVGIEPGSSTALPFPRPVGLDPGSQPLFPELQARHDVMVAGPERQWQVPVEWLGEGRLGTACPVRTIVLLTRQAGARTTIEPISPADAVVGLVDSTFRFAERPRLALETLAELVRGADCHRLVSGSLEDAVRAVSAVARAPVRRPDEELPA